MSNLWPLRLTKRWRARKPMLAEQIAPLVLPAGCVARVWQVNIQASASLLQESLALLSTEENTRAARFYHEVDRLRFATTRAALRLLLAEALHTAPTAIAITYNAFGKPQLAGHNALQFNVSHSGGLALIALVDGARVGVDIEQWREDISSDAALDQIASTQERTMFGALPAAEHMPNFFRLWTLKEALLKAQGAGFQCDPRSLNLAAALRSSVVSFEWADPSEGSRWTLYALDVPDRYSAALAVEQRQVFTRMR